jgi:tetratricopeptide (TPR) repeat protein
MHLERRRPLLWASLMVLAAASAPSRAQDNADPVDPIEDKALHQEAQAKFDEALATFRQAFDACVQQAKSGGAARDRNLARAEVILEKIDSLTDRVTKQGETEKFLAGYDPKDLGPVLESSVRLERAESLLAGGDRAGAAALLEPLGMARHFWVIGPYDNERGRDFKQTHAPNQGIDLDGKERGKERDVSWREVQVDQTLGYVDLDAMLRPNDQASAYAVAFVKCAADADAALRLGSDEAVRAWWNGKEVLTRDVRRLMGFDQDVVGVKAKAGWNTLLLKVHEQTGPWGFRVRVTAADGSPLAGATWAATRAEADEAIKAKTAAEEFKGAVAGGAKQFFDAVAGKGGGPARDLFHLGYLHYRRHFDSFSERQAENLLLKAADAEPNNAVFRFHYAEAAAPPADLAAEKEENRQRAGREKAIAADPNYAVAYRALAGYYTTSVVSLERAEQLLRKALEINPDFWQARLDLAGVLEKRGLSPSASAERDKALSAAAAAKNEDAARARASELEKKGMGPDAASAWREVLALDATGDDVRRRVAELAAQALDAKAAVAVLDEIAAANPYDVGARTRKAELLEGQDDLVGAEASIQDALKIAPEDDNLLQALGRVQEKAGRDKDAIASFREALRINPKLQQLERYVEFLDPAAAPFEDDYRIDSAPLVEKAKNYQNPENDGWLVLLDHTVTRVNPDGTSSTYVHSTNKILTDAGVKRFKTYRAFSRGGDAFKWRLARVISTDKDGKVTVTEAKTDPRRRTAEFPPLVAGDVIDVEYRTDDREQTVFGTYFGEVNYFADNVPVKQSTWTLVTPTDREFHFHQKNFDVKPVVSTRDDGKTRVYQWTSTDVAKVKFERGMPDASELYPQVQVSTYKSWDEFAKWWWNFIRNQQTLSPEMKAKVKELTAGKETRLEKLRAIYEFVTGDITYQAWPFGPHGYQPYAMTAVFDKKEGDCKDKSLLLRTMCGEVGIEVYPVLVNGENGLRSDEDLTLALLGHFNHCIAYVPDSDGKGTPLFLDGTAEYQTVHGAPASFDQGARVVIVTPDGAKVDRIPNDPPEKNGIVQKWKVKVAPDGGAVVEGHVDASGDYAYQLREHFSVEGQRKDKLQQLAAVFGKSTIESSKFSDLKDRSSASIWIEAALNVQAFAKASGDVYTLQTSFLPLSMGWSQYLAAASAPKEREHDAIMPVPMRFRTEADYELPAGWTVDAKPEDVEIKNASVEFTVKTSHEGGKLHMERELRFTGERVKTADFAAFKDAVQKMNSAAGQTWKVKKGDAAKN